MRSHRLLLLSFLLCLACLKLTSAALIDNPFDPKSNTTTPDNGKNPPDTTPPPGGDGKNNSTTTPDPNNSAPPPPPTNTTNITPTPTPTPPPVNTTVLSTSMSTDANGNVVTALVTETVPAPDTSPTPNPNDKKTNPSPSGGFGTGSIIGLSVAGGVAVLGVVGFLVWKLTRKRFSDFDDNEAIKWPELNAHSGGGLDTHPLPTNNTGRAGFDTGSELSLDRSGAYSTSDLGSSQDPYAVPPLPHNNPNQPYRDDPNALSGYYDPYQGPVPNTFHGGGETIPMTQLNNGRMSPAPAVAYGAAAGGRASPAPSASMAAYGGRSSPGPHLAYGRSSPGPQAAYDMYGGQR